MAIAQAAQTLAAITPGVEAFGPKTWILCSQSLGHREKVANTKREKGMQIRRPCARVVIMEPLFPVCTANPHGPLYSQNPHINEYGMMALSARTIRLPS